MLFFAIWEGEAPAEPSTSRLGGSLALPARRKRSERVSSVLTSLYDSPPVLSPAAP